MADLISPNYYTNRQSPRIRQPVYPVDETFFTYGLGLRQGTYRGNAISRTLKLFVTASVAAASTAATAAAADRGHDDNDDYGSDDDDDDDDDDDNDNTDCVHF